MSMTKGTPASSQIIWLEQRVEDLEATIDRLVESCNFKHSKITELENEKDWLESKCDVLGSDLAEARRRIDHLRNIEYAARNLVAQKGRYNTEVAYKLLVEVLK